MVWERGVKEAISVKLEKPSLDRVNGLSYHWFNTYIAALTLLPRRLHNHLHLQSSNTSQTSYNLCFKVLQTKTALNPLFTTWWIKNKLGRKTQVGGMRKLRGRIEAEYAEGLEECISSTILRKLLKENKEDWLRNKDPACNSELSQTVQAFQESQFIPVSCQHKSWTYNRHLPQEQKCVKVSFVLPGLCLNVTHNPTWYWF